MRPLRPVVGGQRDAAGGDRGADRTPEVERPAAAGVVLLGEPGREPPGQRVDLAAHLLEVGRAGGGEVEPVDAGPDGDVGDVVGPFSSAIRRRASASTIAVKRADPAGGHAGRLVLGAAVGDQGGDDPLRRGRRARARCRAVYADQRGQPGPAARHGAEAPHRLDGQPLAARSRSPSASASSSSSRNAQGLRRCRDRPASARRRPARSARAAPSPTSAGSRGRTARRRSAAGTAASPAWRRTPSRTVSRSSQSRAVSAATASRSSASETDRRRPRAAPRRRRCAGRPGRSVSFRRRGSRSSRTALSWSEVCLSTTPRVSAIAGLVEVADLEGDQGARPVDGLRDRRRLLQLQLAQPADGRDQLRGDPVRRGPGTWEETISRSRSASG